MLQKLTKYIAELKLLQLSRKQKPEIKNFTNFFTLSDTILLILPLRNDSLLNVNELINYLIGQGKKVTVFSTVKDFNKISLMNRCSLLEFAFDEINRIGLPNSYLLKRLQREKFDVAINLDSSMNIFNVAAVKLCSAKYRMDFSGKQVDKTFNIQILKKSEGKDYLSLINALNLF